MLIKRATDSELRRLYREDMRYKRDPGRRVEEYRRRHRPRAAFGDVVQATKASSTTGDASVSFSAATAGNLLVFGVGRAATAVGGAWNTISGWTILENSDPATGNMCGASWWKIAAGGETSVATAMTSSSGNWSGAVVEFTGPFEASPFDKSAEDATNVSTVVTSQPSGTTAATTQADELLVALFMADNRSNVVTGAAYTNSFVERISADSASGARAMTAIASLVVSATGTYTTTYSTSGTGDEMYGLIGTFKKQAAAGGNPWYAYAQQ